MKKLFSIYLILVTLLLNTGCDQKPVYNDEAQKTVWEYYERFYDCEINLQYTDMSDILYTESIQSYNKITELRTMITRAKCAIEQGFGHEDKKVDYNIEFYDTVYNDDGTATVTLNIERDKKTVEDIADPYFMYYGKNTFTLVYHDGWKISYHTADNMQWWQQVPTDEKVIYDEQKAIEQYYSEFAD